MGRIVRRVRQAGVYFVTTDTWQKRALFAKSGTAQIVVEQLLGCRDRGFYKLHAFAVMPDHLHVLLTPGETTTIEKAMQMIKGGSAYRIRREEQMRFPVWHAGFHDRWIRDLQEYQGSKHYIEQNPVEAKLVEKAEDYVLSSASGRYGLDLSQFDHSEAGAKAPLPTPVNIAAEAATHKTPSFIAYQLNWKTLPGLRGLSCSEFRAVETAAPDSERGVAVALPGEAARDALVRELEAHFSARRFSNNAAAFEAVKSYVLERVAHQA